MASAKRYRALIVDDNPAILSLLEETFSAMGWAVATVDRGDVVVDRAREVAPDLVLLDLMMPGLDGFSALARLRREPALGETPVILMSGEPASVHGSIGSELGATAYLEKPFDLGDLRVLVDGLFAGEPSR